LLGVPSTLKLVSIIALGYPPRDKILPAVKKRSLEEVIHWEKF